ncbi:MAG: HDIG domain-containing protein [Muribaculaceae bacterium]|nr:HDIG domain-containing protein [Muribaculaceae bacterium]
MWQNFFSRINLIRFGLAIIAVAMIVLALPRTDHQSYSYELNQPWKYPLLTADFDMPILRDSVSARSMRDSIDKVFIPFVKRNPAVEHANIERFSTLIAPNTNVVERGLLVNLLREAYSHGIMDGSLYALVDSKGGTHTLRLVESDANDEKTVTALDASKMASPAMAFRRIDSLFSIETHAENGKLSPEIGKALNICLNPNIELDSATDYKYRSQEYLNVTGATGVIKKGQRIVDRGEIITPQIFTNLNTYQEMVASRQSETSHTYFVIGEGMYLVIVITLLYIFLCIYRSRFFGNVRKMTFLMSFITLFVVFAILMFEYFANGIYVVPFAAVPVIILVFFDSRTAIFALITTVLLSAIVATYQFQFIFMELTVGLVATFSIRHLSRRSQLLRTAVLTFTAYVVTYFTISLISAGNLSLFAWKTIGIFAINSVLLSFAYILILVMEKLFGFTSTVTLVELSDINSPLLRKLSEEAPGTFQHSIQVSTIAADAARAIGANTTLVRTGALYHDIGKLSSPIFFTENQHGVNPHAGLDPTTSAQKIISHVTAGLDYASKANLPAVIREFISEHHGKGLTRYFYNTAVNENPDKVIDKSEFQYPGPNPQSKETAILMMADAVEAASRSLKEYTPEAINNLVDKIIDSQLQEGLLKEAPISFRDIELVKQAFKKRLSTIYHSRVAYPEMKKDTASASAEKEKKEKEAAAGNTDNVITIPEDAGENNEENQSPS